MYKYLKPGLYGLMIIGLSAACDKEDDSANNSSTQSQLSLNLQGLEDLGSDYRYEGWIIVDGAPVSAGLFDVDGAAHRALGWMVRVPEGYQCSPCCRLFRQVADFVHGRPFESDAQVIEFLPRPFTKRELVQRLHVQVLSVQHHIRFCR